ncbi:MAG TPA: NAD(P)H-dependent glycerol-3-phosphate dehydrogenase [Rhodanobacteraceae bacterium]|nr:NAD(P)H-dependent glycerol-3-phosphate dehydrogenase [Rhodanobacteraceae bacterium]
MTAPAAVAVVGAGSWGTALASLLARNGVPTRLWARNARMLAEMAASGRNRRYLPDCPLPPALCFEPDLAAALEGVGWVLLAVPSEAFTSQLEAVAAVLPAVAGLAWATKGFEPGTGRFLHERVAEMRPGAPAAVVTGPSFAREVARGQPTAITVHSTQPGFAQQVAGALHSATFRAYTGSDVLGAELGGAMKNVLAVATGVADGMELGANSRAGLITRGMSEMLRVGEAIGARAETLMGLSGLGDLVLTCTGDLSRNRRLGMALGRGVPIRQALADIGQVVESVVTADEVMRLAARHALDLPISAHVQAVLHGDLTPEQALHALMARERKPEFPST